MNGRLDVMTLTQLVDHPPRKTFVANEGGTVVEDLTLIGWIDAPADKRQYLADHGVDLTYAEFDPDTLRWERCLFSEGVADLLEELHAEGSFPYGFEAGPSEGELRWLEAQTAGATERPPIELRAYLTPATPESLERLAYSHADVVKDNVATSTRTRK